MWSLKAIPQIIHFFWEGEQVSYLRYSTIISFMRQNPDWQVKFYYPKGECRNYNWSTFEQKYPFVGDDYYNEIKELPITFQEVNFDPWNFKNTEIHGVLKSDILRLYLLSTVGGVWCDLDIFFFKPMDDLPFNTEETKNIDTVFCISDYGHSIGLLMASENNPAYRILWDAALQVKDFSNYQSFGSILYNKIFPTIETIKTECPSLAPHNLPMDIVYAYNALMINEIYSIGIPNKTKFTEDSIGVHWYAGHPLTGEYLSKTAGGVQNHPPCVMSKVILDSMDETLYNQINMYCNPTWNILDIGCGDKSKHSKLNYKTIVGIDNWEAFKPEFLWDLNNTPLPFADNSFDSILLLDIIEHLDKEYGLKLLQELKRITKRYIVILTPLFWTENQESVNDPNSPYHKNPYNSHRSLWSAEDFPDWKQLYKHPTIENYFFGVWDKTIDNLPIKLKRFKEDKIFITGLYGSGKSSYAKSYSLKFEIAYIDFDANFDYSKIRTDLTGSNFINKLPGKFIVDAIPFRFDVIKGLVIDPFLEYCKSNEVKIIAMICTDKKELVKRAVNSDRRIAMYIHMDFAYFYFRILPLYANLDIEYYDSFTNEYISKQELDRRLEWIKPACSFI